MTGQQTAHYGAINGRHFAKADGYSYPEDEVVCRPSSLDVFAARVAGLGHGDGEGCDGDMILKFWHPTE